MLTTATTDGRAQVWDVERGTLVSSVDDLQGIVIANAFLGATRFVASSTIEGRARIWDGRSGAALMETKVPFGQLIRAQPSPDGNRVAVPGYVADGRLLVLAAPLEARDAAEIRRLVQCRGQRHLENGRPLPFDVKAACH